MNIKLSKNTIKQALIVLSIILSIILIFGGIMGHLASIDKSLKVMASPPKNTSVRVDGGARTPGWPVETAKPCPAGQHLRAGECDNDGISRHDTKPACPSLGNDADKKYHAAHPESPMGDEADTAYHCQ